MQGCRPLVRDALTIEVSDIPARDMGVWRYGGMGVLGMHSPSRAVIYPPVMGCPHPMPGAETHIHIYIPDAWGRGQRCHGAWGRGQRCHGAWGRGQRCHDAWGRGQRCHDAWGRGQRWHRNAGTFAHSQARSQPQVSEPRPPWGSRGPARGAPGLQPGSVAGGSRQPCHAMLCPAMPCPLGLILCQHCYASTAMPCPLALWA